MSVKRLVILPDFIILMRLIYQHNKTTGHELHRITRISYAHIHSLKSLMLKEEWIKEIDKGNKKIIELTDKGFKIAAAINILLKVLNIPDEKLIEHRKVTGYIKKGILTKLSKPKDEEEV